MKKKNQNPVKSLISSYLLVMFFSVFIISITLIQSYNKNKEYIIELHIKALETGSEIVDRYISLQKKYLFLLSNIDYKIGLTVPYEDIQAPDFFDIYMIINLMKEKGLDENIYIFYKNPEMVINSSSAWHYSQFYKNYISDITLGEKEFKDFLFSHNEKNNWTSILEKKEKGKKILFRHPIRYEKNELTVVAISFIDASKLLDMMNLSPNSSKGNVLLEDSFNKIIDSKYTDVHFSEKNSIMIRHPSEIMPWTYVFCLPHSVLYASIKNSLKMLLLLLPIGLILLIAMTFYYLMRNKKRLTNILDTNTQMKERLAQQRPYMKADFYNNLLYAKFETINQLEIAANLAEVNVKVNYVAVIAMDIQIPFTTDKQYMVNDIDEIRIIIYNLECLLKKFSCVYYISHFQYDSMAIICCHNDRDSLANEIKLILKEVENYFSDSIREVAYIGVGDIQKGLNQCSESYSQARCALYNIFAYSKVAIKYYSEISPILSGYVLTDQTKKLLLSAVSKSDLSQVDYLITKIIRDNFIENNLNESTLQMLLFELCSLINNLKYLIDENDKNFLEEVENFVLLFYQKESLYKISDIKQMFLKITNYVNERKVEYNDKLILEIKKYIDENFNDPNISLQLVSDLFEISESYFSQLFKKYLNINFSQYLEERRLNKACHLLENCETNIKKIAEEVGYSSINTFGRAFKRRYEISAGEYRKIIRKRRVLE